MRLVGNETSRLHRATRATADSCQCLSMTSRTHTAYAEGIGIRAGAVVLEGNLAIPEAAQGVVLFAHGSGSSRFSQRNRAVASTLNDSGIATLLIDLLTAEEEAIDRVTAHLRFDIELLAQRLIGTTDWLVQAPETRALRIGYFGASTGAAAALMAAVERPQAVGAIVSRGGRPDLAGPALSHVHSPTLLIVGGNDSPVIEMNRAALAELPCEKRLEIVPGATHLFEEPGTLERVADLACKWFKGHLEEGLP
jgi:putative phosphoribosyl transferase